MNPDSAVLAKIWYEIMNGASSEEFPSGQWLRIDSETDRLAQPGFVGANYPLGGILLLAKNFGRWGGRLSRVDVPYLAALMNMRDGFPSRLSAFQGLNRVFEETAPYWDFYRKELKPLLDALSRNLSGVAQINLVNWRIWGRIREPVYAVSWKYTMAQLAALDPGLIVVLGKDTAEQLEKRYTGDADRIVVARARNDPLSSLERRHAFEKLKWL